MVMRDWPEGAVQPKAKADRTAHLQDRRAQQAQRDFMEHLQPAVYRITRWAERARRPHPTGHSECLQ